MATAERSRKREESPSRPGLSAAGKARIRIVSDYVIRKQSIDERHPEIELTDEDEARIHTYTPGDPTSDYFGDRESQIQVIAYEREVAAIQALQADSAMRTDFLRRNLPAQVILGDQYSSPSRLDAIPPDEVQQLGE